MVHALLAMWTVLSGAKDPRTFAYCAAKDALFVGDGMSPRPRGLLLGERRASVDVFITVYGEPVETIRRTAPRPRHERRAPHLDPRRRPVRRGQGARRRAGLPLHPPAVQQRRQGRQHQPRPVASPRASSSASSTPTSCPSRSSSSRRAVLRQRERRLRPDAADVRQPGHTSSPAAPATCRRCSTGSSSPAGTTSTPRSASAPT